MYFSTLIDIKDVFFLLTKREKENSENAFLLAGTFLFLFFSFFA